MAQRYIKKQKKEEKGQCQDAVQEAMRNLYCMLIKLYIFCDKVQDVSSKRILLAALVEASDTRRKDDSYHYPAIAAIADAYTNIPASDPLREFLVDCVVYQGSPSWMHDENDCYDEYNCYPHEFCFAVMIGLMTKEEGSLANLDVGDAKYYQDKLDQHEKRMEEEGGN